MSTLLNLFTISLDGMHFLPRQLEVFERLRIPWRWTIVEGAAANVNCTKWCRPQRARFSNDGTREWLNKIWEHPNLHVIGQQYWSGGKVQMCNAAINTIKEPCVLMQVDQDEFWTPEQLERIVDVFGAYSDVGCARFFCDYRVGPNLRICNTDCYGNRPGEWLRAWRFKPGMRFLSHEPPFLAGVQDNELFQYATREGTRDCGLVFRHEAWVFEDQVAYKEKFYGYHNALFGWKELQLNETWPVPLRNYFHWVNDNAMVDLVKEEIS